MIVRKRALLRWIAIVTAIGVGLVSASALVACVVTKLGRGYWMSPPNTLFGNEGVAKIEKWCVFGFNQADVQTSWEDFGTERILQSLRDGPAWHISEPDDEWIKNLPRTLVLPSRSPISSLDESTRSWIEAWLKNALLSYPNQPGADGGCWVVWYIASSGRPRVYACTAANVPGTGKSIVAAAHVGTGEPGTQAFYEPHRGTDLLEIPDWGTAFALSLLASGILSVVVGGLATFIWLERVILKRGSSGNRVGTFR